MAKFPKLLSLAVLSVAALSFNPAGAAEPKTAPPRKSDAPAPANAAAPANKPPPDADVVMSTGRKGGAYWGLGERLAKVAEENQLRTQVVESVGSLQNLERLEAADSPVNLALAQADALHQFLKDHPALANRVDIMESIGIECVYLIAQTGSGVESVADLGRRKNFRIAVPSAESGVAVTYRFLKTLNPHLAGTVEEYLDPASAMQAIAAGTKADALMLVQRPKERTPEIQLALDKPETYTFVAISGKGMTAALPDGQAIYTDLDAPLITRGADVEKSVPTVCTKGLLVASSTKLDPEKRKVLNRIVDDEWMRIYPKAY